MTNVSPPPSVAGITAHSAFTGLTSDDHPQYFYPHNTSRREYGYTAGGTVLNPVTSVEKYDDIANSWANIQSLTTARSGCATFALSGYGYTMGGGTGVGTYTATTEKYDNVADTWTTKTSITTATQSFPGFYLNGYGYVAGGFTPTVVTTVQQYDDVANTWTSKTSLNTARQKLAGFQQNGYGYTAGGYTGSSGSTAIGTTEKYDDVANTWVAKTSLTTARCTDGFSLNSYGYTTGGHYGVAAGTTVKTTEKFDDLANTWTNKADLGTADYIFATFFQNEYGYKAGGQSGGQSAITEKYDDIANTWTAKGNLNNPRYSVSGFSLGIIPPTLAEEVLNIFYHTKNIKKSMDSGSNTYTTVAGTISSSSTITYNRAFNNAPIVILCPQQADSIGIYCVQNISAGSCTPTVTSATVTAGALTIGWFAFEPMEV